MTFPRSNPSIEGNDAAQFASESRGGRLNSDSGQGFFETSHSTTTLQTPRVAANVDSRIPVAEHDQQEDFEQYFKDTPLWTSASPQDRLSYNDSPDARRASDSSERTLYEETAEEMHRSLQKVSLSSYQHPNEIPSPPNAYFSGPPRSYVKRRSGHKSSLDESDDFLDGNDAPLDDVDHEASPHRGVVSNLLELSRVSHSDRKWGDYGSYLFRSGSLSEPEPDLRPRLSRLYSLGGYDADDPRITGATHVLPGDLADQIGLRAMSYI